MRPASGSERGTVTLWILGLCLMVFLLGGISLDLWRAFSERRALAAVADAAAVAGASALDTAAYRAANTVQLVPVEAERRARASLADQLDQRALRGAHVTASTTEVTVVVAGRVDFSLLRILSPVDAFELTVRATAQPEPSR
jgi:Flp pilus assembly protein TadG